MKLNGKRIETKKGIAYVGEYNGKWTIVMHEDNRNVLVRGSKRNAIRKIKELNDERN